MNYLKILLVAAVVLLQACSNDKSMSDASGAFESEETIVAAEAAGLIKEFSIEEGQEVNAGQEIGYIDTMQLYLKKKQLQSQITAILSRTPEVNPQLAALRSQLKSAQHDKERFETLVKGDAAPQKKLDDIITQVQVLKDQIAAIESTLGTTTRSISSETNPLKIQIEQINDQLEKSHIVNRVNGTVLVKYAEANEVAAPGKPLYKVADLSTIILRAYVTGDQLSNLKTGKQVKVLVDNDNKGFKEYSGMITWISDKAEFTPKTIQTKEERGSKVYALKIAVKNDGYLKLGMYAEVKF